MSVPMKGRRDPPTGRPRPTPAPTLPTRQQIEAAKAGILEDAAAIGAEVRHLRAILDYIAESRIVSVAVTPTEHRVVWGCGICEGEHQGYDHPDGRGVYAHKDWCPRK